MLFFCFVLFCGFSLFSVIFVYFFTVFWCFMSISLTFFVLLKHYLFFNSYNSLDFYDFLIILLSLSFFIFSSSFLWNIYYCKSLATINLQMLTGLILSFKSLTLQIEQPKHSKQTLAVSTDTRYSKENFETLSTKSIDFIQNLSLRMSKSLLMLNN